MSTAPTDSPNTPGTPDSDGPEATKSRKPMVITAVVLVLVLLFALAMYLFQPWTAFTTTTVNEELPTTSTSSSADPSNPAGGQTQAKNVVLGEGQFVSLDKDTSGNAELIRTVDDQTIVRLTDFSSSSGPDVKVWLSEEPLGSAESPTEGKYINLGDLKGNKGNQNYVVPASESNREWKSVIIWCERFTVAFGAAELQAGSPTPRG